MNAEYFNATIDRLRADNELSVVDENLERWRQLRDEYMLPVVWACSDARLVLPKWAYRLRSISATGRRKHWQETLDYAKSYGIVLISHFNCGGLNAKAEIEEKGIEATEGALHFVCDHVHHHDPVIHAIERGSLIASKTHKLVLATTQVHTDGSTFAQGVFENGSQTEHKTVPTNILTASAIKKEKYLRAVYSQGIPQLQDDLVPAIFKPVLDEIFERSTDLLAKDPDFKSKQEVQDPEFVLLTDLIKPTELWLPTEATDPGHFFTVSFRRQSLQEEAILNKQSKDEAFKQLNYPLSYCLESNHDNHLSFRNTRVLLIATGSLDASLQIADEARDFDWVQKFLRLPGRELIASQVIKGKIKEMKRVA